MTLGEEPAWTEPLCGPGRAVGDQMPAVPPPARNNLGETLGSF